MGCNCGSILSSLPCCCPSGTTTTTTFKPCVGGEICEEEYTTDCIIYPGIINVSCPFPAGTSYTQIIETILTGFFPICNSTTTTTTIAPITTTTTTLVPPITTTTTTIACPQISIEPVGTTVNIFWSASPGAVNYFVQVKRTSDNAIIYSGNSNAFYLLVSGLSSATQYSITVYPCSNVGCTVYTTCPPYIFIQP